jgi:hypothetical protein
MTSSQVVAVGILGALGALMALAAGCEGPTGPSGMTGPVGSAGQQGSSGTPGATGKTGATGTSATTSDGGAAIPVGCLSPCHGFGGVVDQWKASTHYSTFIKNLGGPEADTWTSPGQPCGNCHAIDAIQQRVTNSVGIVGDGGVANLANGQMNYRNSTTGGVSEAAYTGTADLASVSCTTCHAVTPANDPHKTGAIWTPGSFPFQVASGKSDQAFIEKSPTTLAITGTSIGTLGTSNTCIFCHKSRKDVTSYITASNNITNTYWGPHEGPQSDVYSGQGGYHFSGRTYGTSTHQVKLACVDCHMPKVTANAGVPDHTFNAQIVACTGCHSGAKSFDINGGQSLLKSAMFELQAALNNLNGAACLTRSTAAPYLPLQPSELADGHFELDTTRPGCNAGPLTADQAGALYNYILVARGGALGVHNPKYTQQLVFDSYFTLTGNPPTSIPRPM